jgi:hypothetical protein
LFVFVVVHTQTLPLVQVNVQDLHLACAHTTQLVDHPMKHSATTPSILLAVKTLFVVANPNCNVCWFYSKRMHRAMQIRYLHTQSTFMLFAIFLKTIKTTISLAQSMRWW